MPLHILLYAILGFVLVDILWILLWAIGMLCRFVPLWIEAKAAGIPFPFRTMFQIYFQCQNSREIFECLKVLKKAGIQVTVTELMDHQLAGGHIRVVQDAAVACDKAGVKLGFPAIAALDLAGRNIAKAVHEHVNPVVIPCPMRQKGYENGLIGVAKDGISLAVKCRISVRTNLERLIGMAGAETIVARVGQGIVTTIGKAQSHREIVEHPSIIAEEILARGLDEGTCYEILSLDIEDISIIDNVEGTGRGRQTYRPGSGRRAPFVCGCCRPGDGRQDHGDECAAGRGESQSAICGGQILPSPWRHELPTP